ncbi:MAG: YbdD/YjiX family protein [Terriglobia bacterium]
MRRALMLNLLKSVWNYLREVSGENDYVRYCARMAAEGDDPVSQRDFYEHRQQDKYSRPNRCC